MTNRSGVLNVWSEPSGPPMYFSCNVTDCSFAGASPLSQCLCGGRPQCPCPQWTMLVTGHASITTVSTRRAGVLATPPRATATASRVRLAASPSPRCPHPFTLSTVENATQFLRTTMLFSCLSGPNPLCFVQRVSLSYAPRCVACAEMCLSRCRARTRNRDRHAVLRRRVCSACVLAAECT